MPNAFTRRLLDKTLLVAPQEKAGLAHPTPSPKDPRQLRQVQTRQSLYRDPFYTKHGK